MANNENMGGYKFFRGFLGFIYKLWYNPTIIGKENIPEDGPIVVVGNHINIMDQCNVIISTKRCIHYMAKKEYFDKKYKEGHFAWFFRAAGCIPVDRSIHDDDAKSSALEVLNNGYALGLFPEGTRNGLKDATIKEIYDKYFVNKLTYNELKKKINKCKKSQVDYLEEIMLKNIISIDDYINNIGDCNDYLVKLLLDNKITEEEFYEHYLLPFKFGAVSMAYKTNSKIVPFVITGEYRFRSKDLMIRIGKPIDSMENLEECNKLLRNYMIELIKENHKNNGK